MKTLGYAAQSTTSSLAPFAFDRRSLRANDVAMDVLYCGVCHSDLHMARNDWGWSFYPLVPGHEIVGRVTEVGAEVKKYKVGDHVAVGCMVDSCQTCDQCKKGLEQYCREGNTQTYGGRDRITCEPTYGGYSKHHRARGVRPQGSGALDLSRVAPLLCAGITTYSPLKAWNAGPGSRVGVVGLGGLGHMAVKLAKGLGADVTVLSRSKAKEADALKLGASRLLVSSDADAMAKGKSSFDLIIDTVPVKHDINPYLPLLRRRCDPGPGRRSGRSTNRIRSWASALAAPACRGIDHRRHPGDAGDARLLRQQEHPAGVRNDPHGSHRRGVRADGARRRPLSFRDRHGLARRARGRVILPAPPRPACGR